MSSPFEKLKRDSLEMRITRLRTRAEFRNARTSWSEREIAIFELRDGERVGRGECAPLPGYSQDTLEECEGALMGWRGRNQCVRTMPPAAEYALASALRELEGDCACEGTPFAYATLFAGGAGAVRKIKVGRALDAELAEAREETRPLRFDANQSLGDDAPKVLEALAEFAPEFVEEPVPYEALPSLRGSRVPLALDESLQHADGETRAEEALCEGLVQVLVLKPMALGPSKAGRLAAIAARHGAPVVVSHLFGGPLGYAQDVHFAFEHGRRFAQGLGRHEMLDAFAGWSTNVGRGTTIEPWSNETWPVASP